MNPEPLHVTAALIRRRGRFLLARRAPGRHMAGFWEFPGGKVEAGESHETCLARELQEEFGITVRIGDHVISTTHDYGDRTVILHAYLVRHARGRFQPTSHDALIWEVRRNLLTHALAPADIPIAAAIGAR